MIPDHSAIEQELARLQRELKRERAAREEAEKIAEEVSRRLYDYQIQLGKSEARFHLLFSANPLPIWVCDAQTLAFLEVNETAAHQYGYSLAEFLQLKFTDISLADGTNPVLPEDATPRLQRHRLKDEKVIIAEVTSHRLDYDGRPAILMAAQNVTDRQRLRVEQEERERYFRHLIENAMDLITILNGDGTIRFESPSMEKVLGYKPEDYIGKNAFEFVHPDDTAQVTHAFLEALQNPGPTPPLTFRFRHRDGSWRVLEGVGNNLLADPVMAGIVFNSQDVTERKRIEERYLQAQKVQAIGQLAGGVAHDFNNILTAIIGFSDLMLRQIPKGETLHSYVGEVRKAADRAAALTSQLLAFSRRQVLQPRVFNLNQSIASMDKMLRRLLDKNIDLITLLNPALGNAKADPSQIEQVLLNLTVNARDAMPNGGKLTIETSNTTLSEEYAVLHPEVTAGEYVSFSVSDNGVGIPPEVLPRLFEPFFTTKEQGKGTGLGLATCHGIIKQSGGHISIYSEVGRGSNFTVFLPRVTEKAETQRPKTEVTLPVARGRETVLVVEDEAVLLDLAIIVLSDLGYRVLAADDGVAALRLMKENPDDKINMLITDVIMPNMGGKELAEQVRIISPETKIIFCSGYTQDAITHGGILQDHVTFIQKPYSAEILAQKVRELLG